MKLLEHEPWLNNALEWNWSASLWMWACTSVKDLICVLFPPCGDTCKSTLVLKTLCWLLFSLDFCVRRRCILWTTWKVAELHLTSTSTFLPWMAFTEATDAAEDTVLHCALSSEIRKVSAQNLGEGMSEQLLSTGPVFGLHKDAADKVPCLVGGVRGQQWVGGLGGDLEYCCHGFVFSPRRLFCQHLYHCTTKAPAKDMHDCFGFSLTWSCKLTSWNKVHIFCLCYPTLKLWRNVFSGNFCTQCLQRAASTCLEGTRPYGSCTALQHRLRTWNIPTSVMTCLTALQQTPPPNHIA